MNEHIFRNRDEAGKILSRRLEQFGRKSDVVVVSLVRGGVEVGKRVANELKIPFDFLVVKKIGHPFNPEFAIGAVVADGHTVFNDNAMADIDPKWIRSETERKKEDAQKQEELYRPYCAKKDLAKKTVIVVDDGLATGMTMLVAIKAIHHADAERIIVAVPVAPAEIAQKLKSEVDDLIAIESPEEFLGGVGAYYQDFDQLTDQKVIEFLSDPPKSLTFFMPEYFTLAQNLRSELGTDLGRFSWLRFPNGEAVIRLVDDVESRQCLSLGTIAPPDEQLFQFLMLCHTLNKNSGSRVFGILPYLAYMRQDRNEIGESLAADWIADIVDASGLSEIITIDLHSDLDLSFFSIPVISLSPAQIFAAEINNTGFSDATIVAPDQGAINRAKRVMSALGRDDEISYFKKIRSETNVESDLFGPVSAKTVIVDDILDTGKTLVTACSALRNAGVSEILICVTHGLFSGLLWEELFNLGVSRIITTDSVPINQDRGDKRIKVLPAMPIIIDYLKNVPS